MFLTMIKQTVLITLVSTLLVICSGSTWEIKQLTDGRNQELYDAFVEKIEYVYNYDSWFIGDPLYFTEFGYQEKTLQVDLYWKDGVYYFIPLNDCNIELKIGGTTRRVRYNELNEGRYIFYTLRQRSGIERDNGRWYLHYDTSVFIEEIEEFIYLGMTEIDISDKKKPYTMKLAENGYIKAIVDHIRDIGDLPAGKYKVYIGLYEYYDAADRVTVTGVIRQDEIYRFFAGSAIKNDDGSYDASAYSTNGASEQFPTVEEIPSAYDNAMHIVEAGRLVLDMEITEQGQRKAAGTGQEKENLSEPDTEKLEMTGEEARAKIEELYNYYHWFYGNMPYDIESLLEEGRTYDIYTDKKGNIFWTKENALPHKGSIYSEGGIYRSKLQDEIAGLPLYSYTIEAVRRSELQKIGKMDWHQPELKEPELPHLTEDGYIREVKKYIEDELSEKGKSGSYQIYFGRYELLASDVRNISVAVTGDETFYLQCWVTKYPDGTYECFPVGGSHMGEEKTGLKKVERIVQLERLRMGLKI